MKKINFVFFAAIFLLLVGCSSAHKDIKVDAATDPKANLSGYKTYAWLGSAAVLNDPNGQWEQPQLDLDGEIKYLINSELKKLGMTKVKPENADIAVAFFVGVDMAAEQLKQDPESKTEMLKNIPEGALVVAFIDAETGYAVWVGKATAEIQQDRSNEEVKERLRYAVTNMFKKINNK